MCCPPLEAGLIVLLAELAHGSLYQRLAIDASVWSSLSHGANWNSAMYRESQLQCVALCNVDPECQAVEYSGPGSCQMGADVNELEEGATAVLVDICGSGAFSKNDEKSAWSVASSDPFYSDKLLAGEVINGVTTTAHEVGYFFSDHVLHPWLEIDLGTARWVKGMEVRGGYDLIPQRFKHLEVRVGNESAIGTADDQRICKNQVCYMTGASGENPKKFDCVTPLRGRYTSIQKYIQPVELLYWHMEIAEIDIYFYFCGKPNDICVNEPLNHCTQPTCASASYILTDKSQWAATPSHLHESDSRYAASKAIDGPIEYGDFVSITCKYPSPVVVPFSWLQVELDQTYNIERVKIHGRENGYLERSTFLEVRVGETDVSGTERGKRLCQNSLCYTTGDDDALIKDYACASILRGNYVTVQKYEKTVGDPSPEWCLEINEIYVTVCS